MDSFAGIEDLLQDYSVPFEQLQKVREQLQNLRQSEQDAAQRADMLTFQIQEIEAAKLTPGEDEELLLERTRLANAESLASHAQNALTLIEEGTPEVPGISELLGQAVEALHNLSRIDTTTEKLYEQAESDLASLQDLTLELQNYAESIEFNPRLLDRTEERIDLLNRLKRKYGGTLEAVIAFGEKAKSDLDSITHAEERLEELTAEEQTLLDVLSEKAARLSEKRKAAAGELGGLIEKELDDLRMENARFEVEIATRPDASGLSLPDGNRVAIDSKGYDRVEFLVETNPGEGFKPLVKVASGGETSRLMLALKNVLARADRVPSLIFDEIDQGIGGRVGMVVGEKLWSLSRQHQVMCITHLPQLAAFSDQHYKVTKQMQDGRTITAVIPQKGEDRRIELAQMLGPVGEGTLHSVDEILEIVREKTGQTMN